MPKHLRTRPAKIGAVFVALAMGLVGFLPLFGGPGYESALAAGLLVPTTAALVTALEVSLHRPAPFEAFSRGVANGAALAALAWLTTIGHGFRAGFCDVIGGSAHFALGAGVGALLGGAWGAVAGEIAAGRRRRRLVAVIAAPAGPLFSIGVSLVRFYTSPIIFAYDPFAGYFSGNLYDTIVDLSGLVTYRAASTATLAAGLVVALHLGRDGRGRLAFQPIGRPGLLVLGAASIAASFAAIVQGNRMNHWHTAETIAAELGAIVQGERCDVVYPRTVPVEYAQRFARECDAHVVAGERWLGAPAVVAGAPLRLRAFLFESAAQKGALMGASRTYIAKPWRREIYVQEAGFPHPSLGHEVMHVLAGAFARGPFRVAGRAGGWLPDPGLIEGIAVAGSPREGEDLTAREWAKAMKDLGILPGLAKLFALGFLAENSSTAYTVSGAFVGHVHATYGADALRAWYGGRTLPAITGKGWDEMERAWHAELDAITLPDAARAQAKARFDRPAIFGRKCPRVVDACKERAESLRGAGDAEGALAQYARILELDQSPATRVEVAEVLLASAWASGDPARVSRDMAAEGARQLEQIAADEAVPRHVRDRALEELGDAALLAGEGERAAELYGEVMTRIVDEDRLRTLDVKSAAARDERARPSVVELLVGSRRRAPDKVRAAELLGQWAAQAPADGMPAYLMARHYVTDGRFELAAERLERALSAQLAIERVRREAERLRIVTACALGDVPTAEKTFAAFAARPEVGEARRDGVRRLLARCGGDPGAAAPGGR